MRSPRPSPSPSSYCFPDSRIFLIYISLLLSLKVIESITNNREAQPGFDAVYMLMPTSANIDRIIRDFSDGRQQYAGAHLFFIDGPSSAPSFYLSTLTHLLTHVLCTLGTKIGLAEELFQRLTSSPAEPFLRGLQDLYVNFWGAFLGFSLFFVALSHYLPYSQRSRRRRSRYVCPSTSSACTVPFDLMLPPAPSATD